MLKREGKIYITERERKLGPIQYRQTVCLEFLLMLAIVGPQSTGEADESGPGISSRGPLGPVPPRQMACLAAPQRNRQFV